MQALHRCDPDMQVAVHAAVLLWTAAHNIVGVQYSTDQGPAMFFKVHKPQLADKSYKQHALSRDVLLMLHGTLLFKHSPL